MPTAMDMAMELPGTQLESPTATDHHRVPTESVMLTPTVMATATELPVTTEGESPTATDPHRARMASVMPMPMVVDSSVKPAPDSPNLASITTALVPLLTPLASALPTLTDMVMVSLAIMEAASPTATGLLRGLVPTGVKVSH